MSYENQPEPVLPNYNPSAWAPPLSAEEQEVLDNFYVKYPIAQNAPITFQNQTTIGTVKTNTITSTTGETPMNIANDARTYGGNIEIGCGGLTGGAGVFQVTGLRLGAGTNGVKSYMDLGSSSMETSYFRSKTININEVGSGNTVIGTSEGTGTITVNRPITIGYSAPTVNTQLGFTSTTAITWSGISNAVVAYSPNLPIGKYIVHLSFELNGTFIPSFLYTYSTGASPILNNSVPFVNGGDRILACGSFIIQLTTAGTFALTNFATNNYSYTSPGATVDGVFVSTGGLYITRIA